MSGTWTNRRRLALVGGAGDEVADIEAVEEAATCVLTCEYRGKIIKAEASDHFEALGLIRLALEREGLLLLCYGASLNVYPSGMARDMGRGRKAYRLTLGRPGARADLVGIFDTGPDVVPATVEAQTAFWRNWLATPRT